MTRKDYNTLAGFLRDLKPTVGGYQLQRWRELISYLSIRLAQDNSRFDKVRFHNACDYGEPYDNPKVD